MRRAAALIPHHLPLLRRLSLSSDSSLIPPFLTRFPAWTPTSRLFSSAVQQCEPPEPDPAPCFPNPAAANSEVSALFRRWGCTEAECFTILRRRPSIARMNPSSLQSKLQSLSDLGFLGPDLVRLVTCRPRFLAFKLIDGIDSHLEFLHSLFGSKAVVHRAVVRNPSLLTTNINIMQKCVELYENMGVTKQQLGALMIGRPTIVCRSNLDSERKFDIIRRTCVTKENKLYKYVVSIIAISRVETIEEKIWNLQRFGLSYDEVLQLFGRSPNILTLSIEKVQRNFTFVTASMGLPASTVFQYPDLLYLNLDKCMKPRFQLICKIQDMDLEIDARLQPLRLEVVMRMSEVRFANAFIKCHNENVVEELMEFYEGAKAVRRLAETSRLSRCKGFPF